MKLVKHALYFAFSYHEDKIKYKAHCYVEKEIK